MEEQEKEGSGFPHLSCILISIGIITYYKLTTTKTSCKKKSLRVGEREKGKSTRVGEREKGKSTRVGEKEKGKSMRIGERAKGKSDYCLTIFFRSCCLAFAIEKETRF